MEKLVTVICCTYNHEHYIERTLEGFLKQKTSFSVEYIVRDDASTDRTADIMRQYEKKYPGFFTMIYNQENTYGKNYPGFTARTIKTCKSKYIALCEGDDYWCDENKLQKQVNALENDDEITLCLHAHYELNDKTQKKVAKAPYKTTGIISTQEVFIEPYGVMPATCSMLMRTSSIKDYPYDILHSPVGDRNRRMYLADKGKVYYINEIMSVYRVNNSNSYGGGLFVDPKKSLSLVEKMNSFFNEFDEFTDYKYSSYIEYLKEREWINHYMRFGEYKKIMDTRYYKKYYPIKAKLKVWVKYRFGGLYNIYKKMN